MPGNEDDAITRQFAAPTPGQARCAAAYSSDYRDIVETLKGWGVVRSRISVQ